MKYLNLIGCFILGIILLLSCEKNKDEIPTVKPGFFAFTQINSTKSTLKSSNQSNAMSSNEFDLGDIKKSSQFYFSLSNGGETPIFDISLKFRKTSFTIYPTIIKTLEVDEKLSLVPILKVEIIHGISLDGLGNAALLNMGTNSDTLSIYGKTLSGTDTINIHLDVIMHVNALVADISLFENSNSINFNNYEYVGSQLFHDSTMNSGLDKLRTYVYSGPIKISNTGNVPLEISIINNSDIVQQINYNFNISLQPGVSTDLLNLPLCQNNAFAYIFGVKIRSNGTISDNNKLQYGADGNIYFALENYCK